MKKDLTNSKKTSAILPVPESQLCPLTYTQEALFFLQLHQFKKEQSLLVEFDGSLVGKLDAEILNVSITNLLKRHKGLRSRFFRKGEQILQDVAPLEGRVLSLHDGSVEKARRELRKPFDLSKGPLYRFALVKISDIKSLLLLSFHHIVFDGGSFSVFAKELVETYHLLSQGKSAYLADLPIHQRDYAVWQRNHGDSLIKSHLPYWKKRLEGAAPVLNLPTDYMRPKVSSRLYEKESLVLDKEETKAIKNFVHSEKTRVFPFFVSIFKTLLYRYTGKTDILIGSPFSLRTRRETRGMIGYFVNMLVLRDDLSGDPSFRSFLSQVSRTVWGAMRHGAVPFDRIVGELNPKREEGYHPLCQIGFSYESESPRTFRAGDVSFIFEEGSRGGELDLVLYLIEHRGEIIGHIEYRRDLFQRVRIRRMIRHFKRLLHAAIETPTASINQLPVLTEEEFGEIVYRWNDTGQAYERTLCIHSLFEREVRKSPRKAAVVFHDQSLSYQELNTKANRFARYLRNDLHASPGRHVGIQLRRSFDLIVAAMGALKARCPYLILNPDLPEESLDYMKQDAEVSVLIEQELMEHFSRFHRVTKEEGENPFFPGESEESMCLVYTSGSTGKPKASQISHRSFHNLCCYWQRAFSIGSHDRFISVANISFDASVLETFLPLVSGATLYLTSKEEVSDPRLLSRAIEVSRCSVMLATVSLWKMLQLHGWRCHQRLIAFSGGERLSFDLAKWLFYQKNLRLYNAYGPSEASICSSFSHVQQLSPRIPIGRPVMNVQIYILDAYQNPVPVGVIGEIYIGGEGVLKGYWKQEELNQAHFFKNPFHEGRFYRSGDFARFLPDGNIDYVGRRDDQVKIRGFRIELGEIECNLRQHPALEDAVVQVVKEEDSRVGVLRAFMVSRDSQLPPERQDIRSFLSKRLPNYMVPAQYAFLPSLPRTPNNKLDFKALSQLSVKHVEVPQRELPQGDLEEKLFQIWQKFFEGVSVGVTESFFDLGGNSFSAVRLISELSHAFHREFSVSSLISHPTIRSFSGYIRELEVSGTEEFVVPAVATNRKEHQTIESCDWRDLWRQGELPHMDAVALAYLPVLPAEQWVKTDFFQKMFDCYSCRLYKILTTPTGRIGVMILPYFPSDLYAKRVKFVRGIIEVLGICRDLGVKMVSLTGLIPSATNGGNLILENIRYSSSFPLITTGHATTISTMLLTIVNVLEKTDRSLSQETVGVLGLGSVGLSTLKLMLRLLPHPKKLILCDLYQRLYHGLNSIKKEIRSEGFKGEIQQVVSAKEAPEAFYQSSFMIGATNVCDVLDISRVESGTIIVEDGAPHAFSLEAAISRWKRYQDVLFLEGGVLKLPFQVEETLFMPDRLSSIYHSIERFLPADLYRDEMMGCVYSSLLTAVNPTLGLTIGKSFLWEAERHYAFLKKNGYGSPQFRCQDFRFGDIRKFLNHSRKQVFLQHGVSSNKSLSQTLSLDPP